MDKKARKQKQQAATAAILRSVQQLIEEQTKLAAANKAADDMVNASITEVTGVGRKDASTFTEIKITKKIGCWGKFKQCWCK
jgi:hypothetical protein